MMYQLLFNDYPFEIIKEGEEKSPEIDYFKNKRKDCEDNNLNDLIQKLLIINPVKRISWDEYFNHPFFNNNKKIEDA